MTDAKVPAPPRAAPRPSVTERHGDRLEDPYAWLKDENWQQVMREPDVLDGEIRAYLEAENDYTTAILAPVADLKGRLFEEIKGRIKEDDSSVPAPDGAYEYYRRYETGGQHPLYCRRTRDGNSQDEEILLHGDREAEGHPYFDVAACRQSPDHRRLAYATDLNGSEIYTIQVKDLTQGRLLDDTIANAHGALVWANDGETFFYTVLDDNHRPSRVYRHRVGDDPATDALIYEEPDAGFFVSIGRTESRRFIVIDAHDHETSEVRLIDAAQPDSAPVLVAARETELEYSVSHHGDQLIILTNADGAEDFKLMTAPVDRPGRQHWQDLVPHQDGTLIVDMELFADHLVRLERRDGLPRIVIRRLSDGDEHRIAFDEAAYSLSLLGGYEFETTTLRFAYSSMTTPEQIYDYDMTSRDRSLRKQQEVPSGHNPDDYVTHRIFATSHDGETVPVSILFGRDTKLDGSAPLLLYGYGSYGHAIPASFSVSRLSLVDRGFVYAIAHIRGGTERGYGWYLAGKREHKMNTFLDFIGAAEKLRDDGYARPGAIACHGGSAGGMLVGAVANLRPDLFNAVIGEVPFVDVLNTMCDDTLPLTPPEWPEWGNPIEDPAAYRTIKSYSPYDNVAAVDYPHMMITAGLTDPRVTYWEPAKWVAKLRALKTDQNTLLLHTNMDAGHGGAAGRFDRLKETAMVYAFLLLVFGMTAEDP
ncbi:MAG: S9 family peptidase [Alphaproteobacteria bacterium]|nr:S9 family peptidase [Alphaproteobacteria bacterium]